MERLSTLNEVEENLQEYILSGKTFAIIGDVTNRWFSFESNEILYNTAPSSTIDDYFIIKPWDEGEKGFKETSKKDYFSKINQIVSLLNESDISKVVISRTICLNIDIKTLHNRIIGYFRLFPSTFRFAYYTPSTGLWFGASPELLLDQSAPGHIQTMALAGTRERTLAPWDKKNIEEHNYVVDYIVNIFSKHDLKPQISQAQTLEYGEIEHLCTKISTSTNRDIFQEILEDLNPTPALCGCPKQRAKSLINAIERHSRGCYGGYIEFKINSQGIRKAFVNLRSASVDTLGTCTVFAGGGIIASSIPEDEWLETSRKAAPLLNSIKLS